MKIRTQFVVTMILSGVMLVIVIATVLVTSRKINHLNAQTNIIHRIERDISDLNFLANDYLLFHESQQRARWEAKFKTLIADLSGLKPDSMEQQVIADNIERSWQRLQAVFADVAAALSDTASSRDSADAQAFIQVAWSRIVVPNQGIAFDAHRLEGVMRSQIERLRRQRNIFISVLLLIFSAYFLSNYLLFYRRTLLSIDRLRSGTEVVGAGELDFVIPSDREDEIGELSRAFNRMTANLKHVTASKADLEKEIAERLKVEAELNRQREWLQVTLSSIGDAVIAADTSGRVAFINPVAVALTGWMPEEALGQPVQSIVRTINENTGEPGQDIVQCVLTEGCIVHMANHTALVNRKGEHIPIEDSAAPIRDGVGNLIGAVLVFRDVTEKRRAQASLRGTADRLRIVADFPYDWEYWRSLDNRFLYVSPSCERITGYNREEFIHDPGLMLRIVHPDDRERISTHMREDLFSDGACELEFRILHRDGGERWIGHVCQTVVDGQGRPMGRRVSNRDITDRKRAEDALRYSEERYRSLFETMNEGFALHEVIRDAEGRPCDYRFLDVNPAFERQTGLKADNLINRTLRDVLPDAESYWIERFGQVALTGKPDRFEQFSQSLERWYQASAFQTGPGQFGVLFLDITDRKRDEETLRQVHQRAAWLAQFPEQNPNPVVRVSADGIVLYCNPASEKLRGWNCKVGQLLQDEVRRLVDRALAEEREVWQDLELGDRIWMLGVAPVPEERHATIYYSDITDRNRAETALRRSEHLYRELVQNANSAIIRWRSDGTIVFFNEYAQKFFGYRAEEVVGKPVGILVPQTESTGADLQHLVNDIVENPEQFVSNINENVCRDGRRVWMRWTNKPIFDKNGEVAEILAVGNDFTQIKETEQVLQRNSERSRLLSETAARLLTTNDPQVIVEDLCRDVMAHLDCQACFNFVVDSEAGRLHLNVCIGIPEEEIRKIEWLDYGAAVCGCVARDGERIIAENIGSSCDSRTDLVASFGIRAYACHPLIIQDRVIGTLSFGTRTRDCFLPEDLDLMKTVADQVATAMDRKRILSDLQRSRDDLEMRVQDRTVELEKRARQLSFLASELTLVEERERRRLAGILHDNLQQLLVAAKMNIEILSGSIAANQKPIIEQILDLMTQSIKVSRSLTDELSPPVLQHYGLSASLKWLGGWMKAVHDLSVDLSVDPSLDPKQEDYNVLLFQSVRELLFNAVKHAGVKAACVEMRRDSEGRHRIVVSDQGVGFDPKSISENALAGNGLGLFSIRERMMLLGGNLEIESEPGKGASFSLLYSLEDRGSAEAEPSAIEDIPTRSDGVKRSRQKVKAKIRVMLVDDHEVVRRGLSTLLENNPGLEVVGESSDGEEAVQMVREILPDVILMDVDMPKMNGLEATRRIHSAYPHIRIIILSMYEGEEEGAAALSAGAVAFMTKSGISDRLLAAIRGETG